MVQPVCSGNIYAKPAWGIHNRLPLSDIKMISTAVCCVFAVKVGKERPSTTSASWMTGYSFVQSRDFHDPGRLFETFGPYGKCKICGKMIAQRSNMSRHMRTHTGEKPHKCDVCGRRFTQRQDMQSHRRIHTGEKPYKCALCDKAFVQRQALRAHVQYHDVQQKHHTQPECESI